jgi:predicted MFS family arabinose efflux permease
MVGFMVFMASVLAAAFPAIDGAWSFPGVMGAMAAATLVCAGLALALPAHGIRGGADAPARDEEPPPSSAPVFLSLGGFVAFYVGITAVWGFAGILGDARGLGEGEVASVISVSLGGGLVGSLVGGVLGDRVRALSAILLGSLGIGATFILLAFEGGYWFFLVTLLAMNGFWNLSLAYQAGMIAAFDVTGRFTILMTAGQTAGALLGPGMMGLILDSTDGFGLGLAFAGVWILVAYVLFWKAAQSGASARS